MCKAINRKIEENFFKNFGHFFDTWGGPLGEKSKKHHFFKFVFVTAYIVKLMHYELARIFPVFLVKRMKTAFRACLQRCGST